MGRRPLPLTPVKTSGWGTRYEPYLQTPMRYVLWWANPMFYVIVGLLLYLLLAATGRAQQVTTVADTLVAGSGGPVVGTVTVTNSVTMVSADGFTVPLGQQVVSTIGPNGQFSVALVPNVGAAPQGSVYYADYVTRNARYRETWVVPSSLTPVTLQQVRVVWPNAPNVMIPMSQLRPPPPCTPATGFGLVARWTPTGWICAADNTGAVTLELENPAVIDAGKFQWKTKNGLQITRISCSTDSGTVSVNLDVRAEGAPNSSGTPVLAAPLNCGPSTSSTTLILVPGVPAGALVALLIVGVNGAPQVVRVHPEYQLN